VERTKQNSSNTSLANVHKSTSIHRPRRCKKAHKFYELTVKALKLCGTTLKGTQHRGAGEEAHKARSINRRSIS